MTTLRARLCNPQQAKVWLDAAYLQLKPYLLAEHFFDITIKPEKRNDAQNRLLWACLTDISQQVEWYGKKLDPEDWKNLFSSSARRLAVVPNLDGTGFVAMGQSTSKLTKAEFANLLELVMAFGADKGVVFTHDEVTA